MRIALAGVLVTLLVLVSLTLVPLQGQNLFQTAVSDFRPTAAGSSLSIEAGRCAGAKKPAATATITSGNGNGSFVAYCTDSQTIVVEYASPVELRMQCSGCVPIQVTTPNVPDGMYRIASGTITGGAFASVTDERDFVTATRHTNGVGMNVQCSGATCVHQVDPAIVQLRTENVTPIAQLDAAKATMTRPFRMAAAVTATCTPGEYLYVTGGAAGKRLHECSGPNQWTPVAVASVARTFFGLASMAACQSPAPTSTPFRPELLSKAPVSGAEASLQCGDSAAPMAPKSLSSRSVTTVAPPDWTGTLEARIFAVDTAQGLPTGNWKLQLAVACAGNGTFYDSLQPKPLWTGTVKDTGHGKVAVSELKNLSTGCKAGDLLSVQLQRLGTDLADTSTAPLKLLGIELGFATN